eukprot:615662-Lingulodinium_polyedra.AAC.1
MCSTCSASGNETTVDWSNVSRPWDILVTAIHNDGALAGSTTSSILLAGLESTTGCTWKSTMQ